MSLLRFARAFPHGPSEPSRPPAGLPLIPELLLRSAAEYAGTGRGGSGGAVPKGSRPAGARGRPARREARVRAVAGCGGFVVGIRQMRPPAWSCGAGPGGPGTPGHRGGRGSTPPVPDYASRRISPRTWSGPSGIALEKVPDQDAAVGEAGTPWAAERTSWRRSRSRAKNAAASRPERRARVSRGPSRFHAEEEALREASRLDRPRPSPAKRRGRGPFRPSGRNAGRSRRGVRRRRGGRGRRAFRRGASPGRRGRRPRCRPRAASATHGRGGRGGRPGRRSRRRRSTG